MYCIRLSTVKVFTVYLTPVRWMLNMLLGWMAWLLFSVDLVASPVSYPIHYMLDREEGEAPIIYYFSEPEEIHHPYPILVLCDGSESKGSETSVLIVRNFFAEHVSRLHVGYLTLEKWGIDHQHVDRNLFWNHYTRSQRLKDHLAVLHYLEQHPPVGWNGQCIFAGVSEGGPLVLDLSILYPNTIATINWSGAGDASWADELWQFFEHWKAHSIWMRIVYNLPKWFPFSFGIPRSREEFDALVQEILANPSPEFWMGGLTYMYHADAFLKPPLDYTKLKTPLLVVGGAEDSIIDSCDQFVQKAQEAGVPITYFRVDGMDHYIRKQPDIIDLSFDWLQHQISTKNLRSVDENLI